MHFYIEQLSIKTEKINKGDEMCISVGVIENSNLKKKYLFFLGLSHPSPNGFHFRNRVLQKYCDPRFFFQKK